MGYLIDTSILIENERGRLDLEPYLQKRGASDFFLSVITASELLHGVHRAQDARMRSRRSAWVEAILERFPLLPIDLVAARAHAGIWAELAASGRLIGNNDLWLAAAAMAHGLTLVTANQREFERVAGLEVENWLQATPGDG